MRKLLGTASLAALLLAGAFAGAPAAQAETWDIAKAATPYKGTELHVKFDVLAGRRFVR